MKQEKKANLSKLYRVNLKDIAKGLVVAVVTACMKALYAMAVGGSLDISAIDWANVLGIGITAGLGYILTQLGTNSEDQILTREKV